MGPQRATLVPARSLLTIESRFAGVNARNLAFGHRTVSTRAGSRLKSLRLKTHSESKEASDRGGSERQDLCLKALLRGYSGDGTFGAFWWHIEGQLA